MEIYLSGIMIKKLLNLHFKENDLFLLKEGEGHRKE